MKIRLFFISLGVVAVSALFTSIPAGACTSVIVSGKATTTGRPVMFKHRDTGQLNNRIERFKGEKYSFVALVNSDWRTNPSSRYGFKGEAWSGTNNAGFCIMNTATYDLKDDDIPDSEMDREGIVMFRALEICANISDFENLLDTLSRPMGVEANFGVIDAFGGAAYYEVNNHSWTKFAVDDIAVSSGGVVRQRGYDVVTNYTRTGRFEDRKGVDRFEKASSIMESLPYTTYKSGGKIYSRYVIDHDVLLSKISRSGAPILRDITSAVVVFEGVAPGENPLHTVMWTALGYPTAAVALPVLVLGQDRIPSILKANGSDQNAEMCTNALYVKDRIRGEGAFAGGDILSEKVVVSTIEELETLVDRRFASIYDRWVAGSISDNKFSELYDSLVSKMESVYRSKFATYLKAK